MAKVKSVKVTKAKKDREMTIAEFIALPDAEKDRIHDELEALGDRAVEHSRSLNAADKKRWKRFKKRIGRPQVGKGSKMVALSIERDLLVRADKYAKAHGLKRAELVAQGLLTIIGAA